MSRNKPWRTASVKMEIDLNVRGSFSPHDYGSHDQPPTDAEFEIKKVFLGSLDITTFLPPDFNWSELEARCIEQLESEEGNDGT